MNTLDLHTMFKVSMDKNAQGTAFGGCPAFLPEEIDLFLNLSYIDVICNKFTGNNARKIAFEQDIKRIADLLKLIKTDKVLTLVYPDSSSNVLTLTNYSKEGTTLKRMLYVDCVLHFDGKASKCTLTDHVKARSFLLAYDNIPWIETPVATLEDDTLKIYIDPINMAASAYSADITYVKYPVKIDYTNYNMEITEVPDYVLYEVVDRAVVIALENIESKRAETKVQLNNISE